MLKFTFPTLLVSLLAFSTNVLAYDDDSYKEYDSIVNELKASADEPMPLATTDTDWDAVAMHGALGISTSLVSITAPDGTTGSGLMKGVQFGGGVNLFSRKIRAEAAFTNFAQENLDRDIKADLKEFEVRAIFLPVVSDTTTIRIGAGVAARYMDVRSYSQHQWTTYTASTPSSLFLLGMEKKVSKSMTLGPDLSYRSTLVTNTYDKSSWDASFRLNATF